METITSIKLNQKINSLPLDLLMEVDKYIDFLKYKHSQNDWADELSEQQIQLVQKGKKDIEENRIMTHQEAKEKIKNHIKNKAF